jgi:hypothetical protein
VSERRPILRGRWWAPVVALAARSALAADPCGDVEQFDLAGLPAAPTTFLEQQIGELLAHHRPDDRRGAALIQRKLARRYAEMGDAERARAADQRASCGEGSNALATSGWRAPSPADSATTPPASTVEAAPPTAAIPIASSEPQPVAVAPARPGALHGRFYGTVGRTLHTWDFAPDGTFLHTTIAAGSGTSVRNRERGRFRVDGDAIVFDVESTAGGFVTPAVGGRATQLGATSGRGGEARRVAFEQLGADASEGIVLAGARLKPRSW